MFGVGVMLLLVVMCLVLLFVFCLFGIVSCWLCVVMFLGVFGCVGCGYGCDGGLVCCGGVGVVVWLLSCYVVVCCIVL